MRSRAAAAGAGVCSSAGQALLLAVIVMLIILLVGGLFVALVTYKQSRAGRLTQMTEADSVVLMGLDYADHELTYGIEGADWRPPAPDYGPDGSPATSDDDYSELDVDMGWTNYTKYRLSPNSYYLLKVTYQPQSGGGGGPTYIVVECIGVVEGEAPSYTRRIAYKAVPLVSFGRYVTDYDRDGEPAVMGVPAAAPTGSLMPGLTSRWTGWHYYNVPVQWLGSNDFAAIQASNARIYTPQSTPATGGQAPPAAIVSSDNPLDHEQKIGRIEPPDLDARDPATGKHRLRTATKESGQWVPGSSGSAYNTGEYGWGAGIYIDNFEDVQFVKGYKCPICGKLRLSSSGDPAMEPGPCTTSGCAGVSTWDDQVRDLTRLRQNWLRAGKTSVSDPQLDVGWNATREWYEPKDQYGRDAAVKITLFASEAAANAWAAALGVSWPVHEPGAPGILIERSGDDHNWYLADRSDSGAKAMMFDYPANGLIYAEGNICIKGWLPPSTPAVDRSLTVCSGATIYIDGDILTPEDTGIGAGTRIALLAEDYVCVNPTQIAAPLDVGTLDPAAVQEPDPNDGWYFGLNPGESLGVRFVNGPWPAAELGAAPGGKATALVAKQCASDDTVETDISLAVNGVTYDFADRDMTSPNELFFRFVVGLAAPWVSNSFHPQYERLAWSPNPTLPWRLDDVRDGSGNPAYRPNAGDVNAITLTNWGQAQYCLKRFKIEEQGPSGEVLPALHTTIHAAIYAQKGSFFVIPGAYFDRDAIGTADEARFGRYNYDIWVRGAVAEEHPAPPSDAYQWMEKWTFARGGNWYQPWVVYDPSLTGTNTKEPNLPKLPKLPLGPGFVYVGEKRG